MRRSPVIGHAVAVVRPPGVEDEELAEYLTNEVGDTLGAARAERDRLAAGRPGEELGIFEVRGAFVRVGERVVAGRDTVSPRRVE